MLGWLQAGARQGEVVVGMRPFLPLGSCGLERYHVWDGLGEEVEEGAHQGVTLFTKPRGLVRKDKSLGTCAETATQFPLHVCTLRSTKESSY